MVSRPCDLMQGWASGPVDERGTLLDLSDRPILCGDTDWNQASSHEGVRSHAVWDQGRVCSWGRHSELGFCLVGKPPGVSPPLPLLPLLPRN